MTKGNPTCHLCSGTGLAQHRGFTTTCDCVRHLVDGGGSGGPGEERRARLDGPSGGEGGDRGVGQTMR